MTRAFLILFIMAICFSSLSVNAENYYIAPDGSDANTGTSPETAWATLQQARAAVIGAGDTLFIMGGTYTNAQYFHDLSGTINGTESNPLVFKAYGDEPAIFTSTGPNPSGPYYRPYIMFYGYGNDNIVVDGYGYLPPYQPLYLKFEGHEESHSLVQFYGLPGNYCENILVKGVEIDGGHTGGYEGLNDEDVDVGLALQYCRVSRFENNYIHHIHHATGDIYPGDNTGVNQGSGHGIYLYSCELLKIDSNRIERCNHGAIEVEIMRPDGHATRYCKITNNVIDQHFGGGIYLSINPHHNLIEGNLIAHCGESTTFSKPAIQLSGSNNTIRKNIIFNPMNQPIRMEAQSVIGFSYIVRDNLIYNNTTFKSWYGLGMMVRNWGSPDCATENNTIVNNIFHIGTLIASDGRQPEITINVYDANEEHNWCDPNAPQCLPDGTHWGGNIFHNNCIRRNDQGADFGELIIWARDQDYGGGWTDWTLDGVQNNDPIAWANNHGLDPLLRSESPDEFGLTNGWWYITEASPCVDAGIVVYDELGAYVESMYPGYGWGNLSYVGSAPDMGAHEFGSESGTPLSAPNIGIRPGNR